MELIRVLGERRRDADQERTKFSGSTVAQRVATVLAELAIHHRHLVDGPVALPLTQDELAALAATSRSGVARALAALRQRKIGRSAGTVLACSPYANLQSWVKLTVFSIGSAEAPESGTPA